MLKKSDPHRLTVCIGLTSTRERELPRASDLLHIPYIISSISIYHIILVSGVMLMLCCRSRTASTYTSHDNVDDTARVEKNGTKRTRRLAATAAEAKASERHIKRSCGGKLRRASFLYGEQRFPYKASSIRNVNTYLYILTQTPQL